MEAIERDEKPDYFIVNYIPLHDERNTMNNSFRQKFKMGYEITMKNHSSFKNANYNYPSALILNDKLKLKQINTKEIYNHFPLREKSTLINKFENIYNKLQVNEIKDIMVTKKLFSKINELCHQNKIKLIVTYMDNSASTQEISTHCQSLGIKTIDISVDFNNSIYTNYPYDSHPSRLAHQIFAEKLAPHLNSISLN